MAETAMSLAGQYVLPKFMEVVNMLTGLQKEVEDTKDELESFQDFINDADQVAEAEKDNNRRDRIKKRVKQMREVVFRMEDVIDEYMICEERQLDDHGCATLPCEAVDYIKTLILRLQIAYKIRNVKSLVHGERYGFQSQFPLEPRPNSCRGNQSVTWHKLRMDPLFIREDEVVGFDGPRDMLKNWLIGGRKERTVISVVGMPGLGKTTLAKQVFDNKEVFGRFDCHALITVSQSYTVEGLLRDMLQQFCKEKKENPPHVSTMDRRSLIDEVRNHLHEKRYVILFDDVWNEIFWDDVEVVVIDDKNGSRILITTRYKKVAEFCRRSSFIYVHELQPLIEEKSLELFYKKAFQYDFDGCCPKELVDISVKIVRKCKGLPLAIVAIGGVLSRKEKSATEWNLFSQNLSLELERNSKLTSITKILGLSYDDLSYNLRSCLLYFGMYPQDFEVKFDRLIRQWIAEGFVKLEREKSLEDVAQQYLTELILRSLVQVCSFTIDGKIKGYRTLHLLHEMILGKIKDIRFCRYIGEHDQSVSSGLVRRLTIATCSNDLIGSIESSHTVLDFDDSRLFYVPENLGNLIHLKYLSLKKTWVESLPKSIGKFQNLETLDVRQSLVFEMPKEIGKLRKLRYLLANTISSIQLKDSLGGMTSLQKLSLLSIDDDGVVIIVLAKLRQLRDLRMYKFRGEYGKTLCSSINEMPLFGKLYIYTENENEAIDLHCMLLLSMLRKLYLHGNLGNLPNWIPQLQNLVKLFLVYSNLTNDPLEFLKDLPSLMFLSIGDRAYEGETLPFRYGGFQKLQELELKYLRNLNSIFIDKGALQSLEKLWLTSIPQLKTAPSGIQHLKKLKVLHVLDMPIEFEQHIAPSEGQEHWIIQHVPLVRIWSKFYRKPREITNTSRLSER
uniref:Disease resistance protein RPM1 n=1 Tax=Cajanus cajan TaxID=3821 RepID=A0A151R5G5_CAJCA|nr:Disease resistance protein RPM1 [Cajanus cajan]